MTIRIRRLSLRELLVIGLPALALIVVAFWVASKFVKPAPPERMVMSTGSEGGAYYEFGKRYAAVLARNGVTLEVRASAGSIENLKRLSDPAGGVEVALVQGGIKSTAPAGEASPALVALAAVAYEPLWVFVRAGKPVDHLLQLKGMRLAVGLEGSGTRSLAAMLLKANGLDMAPSVLLPLGGQPAADALAAGEVDAVFLVAAVEAPLVQQLLAQNGVQLAHFATAEAYARRFTFLDRLTLPQSAVSFTANIPPRDITLLSPTAFLVAREDAHPALVFLLLQAAAEVHREAGLLQRAREFPAARPGEFELSKEAERYFEQGPPLLQRIFPFWLANFIDRTWVLLLPLVAILLPLLKIVPPLYDWRVKSKVFKRYGELRYLESAVDQAPDAAALEAMLARVVKLEDEVRGLGVPRSYSELFFTFRLHADMVRGRIRARLAENAGPAAGGAV